MTKNETELYRLYDDIKPYISETGGREEDSSPQDGTFNNMMKRILELEEIIGI